MVGQARTSGGQSSSSTGAYDKADWSQDHLQEAQVGVSVLVRVPEGYNYSGIHDDLGGLQLGRSTERLRPLTYGSSEAF